MSLNIPNFLKTLNSGTFSIPIEANFVIEIEDLMGTGGIIDKLNQVNEIISPTDGYVNVTSPQYWSYKDLAQDTNLFFANGVTIPGETSTTERVGTNQSGLHGGLLTAPILKGRNNLANLDVNFFETNLSFIDSVLRPWSIAIAQFGLFARGDSPAAQQQNFKTKIIINFLNKEQGSGDTIIRKRVTFSDAAPVSVAGFDASFGATGKNVGLRTTKTTWTYSKYKIDYPAFPDTVTIPSLVAAAGNPLPTTLPGI
jgi:hypothetical protein